MFLCYSSLALAKNHFLICMNQLLPQAPTTTTANSSLFCHLQCYAGWHEWNTHPSELQIEGIFFSSSKEWMWKLHMLNVPISTFTYVENVIPQMMDARWKCCREKWWRTENKRSVKRYDAECRRFCVKMPLLRYYYMY